MTKKENKINLERMPAKKEMDNLVNAVLDLEPLGVLNLNRLKASKFGHFSMGITRPIDPTAIHEFGSELDVTCGSALILPTINMAYHLLKLEVLKEAYYYQDDFNSWMLRLVHRANKYPNYYHKELLRMPDGRETAEVIFWAKSAEGVKGIQEWFKAILGNQTLQDKVDESFAITCDMLAENFYKDPDMIEFFEEYGPLMVGAYGSKPSPNVNNKNQKKKGK